MKIALCLIVKPTNDEAIMLNQCLENIHKFVDKVFITITGENKLCEEVARKYNSIISYYEWDNNFAKARNFNFSQVPKEYDYIMWSDADDIWRGLDELRKIIEKNPADVYSMFYLYAFDEWKNPVVVHQKVMVVKNDGCVEWNNKAFLHEDFKQNRKITGYFIKGIERIHTSTSERFEAAKIRNVEVAQKQVQELPNDPRSYWNLGNSFKAAGKENEAIEQFETFLKLSLSDEEKYIAQLRMAESLWSLKKREEAITILRNAIGLKPEYPDAYNLMGALLLESGQATEAINYLKSGLIKHPPYYTIIVYNPRDYDYVPLMNLAKAYFAAGLPSLALEAMKACVKIYPKDNKLKDLVDKMKVEADKFNKIVKVAEKLSKIKDKKKLKKEFDKIPIEMKSAPAICRLRNLNFVKTKSSGRDIAIMCSYTREEWTPETAKIKGIGGSEEAVINLSQELSQRGWNITVYNNCGNKELNFNGVIYKPFWTWNYRDKQDIVILWRHPQMADYDINADKVFLDLHDVLPAGELNEKRLKKIDKIFVKSNFHRSLYPNIPDDKFTIIPNGIISSIFKEKIEKDKYLIINTSSPDRSISALVKGFKLIKEQIPEAKCYWAYGWGVFDMVHSTNAKIMEWKENIVRELSEVGIVEMGRLSHPEINELYKKAKIFAYPSEFAEIDCISLTKALAANCWPVTTDFAAMGGKAKYGGDYIHSDKNKDNWAGDYQFDFALENGKIKEWADKVIKALKENKETDYRTVLKDYNWSAIADRWETYLWN